MSKQWCYQNPVSLHYGVGVRKLFVDELTDKSCLIVTTKRGRKQFSSDPILSKSLSKNQATWIDTVSSNPSLQYIQSLIDGFTNSKFDVIIGFGGGSSIDVSKSLAIGLLASTRGLSLLDLLVNPNLANQFLSIPVYAIPTTSGTGSEVTPFATIWDFTEKKKYSLSGASIFPIYAFVDPELGYSVPTEIAISVGLDAINQALESIWNKNSNTVSFLYASKALKLGLPALYKISSSPTDFEARRNMSECSLLAGLAISHTRTALCHSISYPLTARFDIPHGFACAFTAPEVLRLNQQYDDGRFVELERILGLNDLLGVIKGLNQAFNVKQQIKSKVLSKHLLMSIKTEMYMPSRANNNLAPVTLETISTILERSWD